MKVNIITEDGEFKTFYNELDEVKDVVRNIMENTFKLSVPLKVEMEVGNDWFEAK